jgi:hypothetical protein
MKKNKKRRKSEAMIMSNRLNKIVVVDLLN